MKLAGRDLACRFGGVRAVDGITLEVDGGTCVAVIGGNGSGKSTLLDLLSGVRRPTGGSVQLDGDPVPPRADAFAARGVRRSFQEPRLAAGLSVDENIALGLQGRLPHVLGIPLSSRAWAAREVSRARAAVGLAVPGWRAVTGLSYGERKRVELARVLVAAPAVALLDEPLAGVAGDDRAGLVAAIGSLVTAGAAVLVVEHDTTALAAVAHRVVVLERGRVVAERHVLADDHVDAPSEEAKL